MKRKTKYFFLLVCQSILVASFAQQVSDIHVVSVDSGWANNSINSVIFRKNSLVSFQDTQFISYYDKEGYVVVGKRKLDSPTWQLKKTQYGGNINDAHNSISIMVDGNGYIHLAWDHHNNPLNYCISKTPGSLEFGPKIKMTGTNEETVSYPEFYKMPDGSLLFLYRDGQSGKGNLVINWYDIKTKKWQQVQHNLIDGEGKRNAYWQTCVDARGVIHISWVWRETPDIASNHDMCYARSKDNGQTWENSKGEKYTLPINAQTAETAWAIPEKSELINQTSMYANEEGKPFIATYWKDATDLVPQYHILYNINNLWEMQNLGFKKSPFSLSGAGTKRIPISRPQIISFKRNEKNCVAIIFRDEERGSKASVAINSDIKLNKWTVTDLTNESVGSWEPTYDTELWKNKKQVNLFIQFSDQKDGEGKSDIGAQLIKVLAFKIK